MNKSDIKIGDWVYTFDNATDYLIGSVIGIRGEEVFGAWSHSISLPKDYYDLSLLQFKTMYDVSVNKNELHKLNLNNNIKQIKNDESVIQLENGNVIMPIIEGSKNTRGKMHLFTIGVDWDEEYGKKRIEEGIDYFNNILNDWHSKDYSKELTADVRCKIFNEHKDDIVDNQIKVLNEENIRLKKEIKKLRFEKGFRLTESEMQQIEKWDSNHKCTLKKNKDGYKYVGAIGGHLTYCFTPTGLGDFVTVKCICGKEFKLDRNY